MSDISPPHSGRALPPRAVAALLIAFVAIVGAVAGAAIDRVLMHKGPALVDTTFHPLSQALRVPTDADRRHLREQLSQNLGLTAAQDRVIDSIMNHRSGEFNALREELRPRVERLVLDVRADIEQVLTPEQRTRFHALQQAMGTPGPNLRASGTSTAVTQP